MIYIFFNSFLTYSLTGPALSAFDSNTGEYARINICLYARMYVYVDANMQACVTQTHTHESVHMHSSWTTSLYTRAFLHACSHTHTLPKISSACSAADVSALRSLAVTVRDSSVRCARPRIGHPRHGLRRLGDRTRPEGADRWSLVNWQNWACHIVACRCKNAPAADMT